MKWIAILFCSTALFAQTGEVPRVSYAGGSRSTLLLEVDGKQYYVDVASQTVREAAGPSAAASLFQEKCAVCHGAGGKGNRSMGTPDFGDPGFQRARTDQTIKSVIHNGKGKMPAWGNTLSEAQIADLTQFVRSFGPSSSSTPTGIQVAKAPDTVYQPGDDVLFSLPTGRPVDKHSVTVNFTHRFAYDSAVSGQARGAELFGLDNFALSSFGFRYGVTDKLSVDVWRSPSFIGRPIQLMAAYNLLEETHGAPLNLTARVSIEGQDNFRKNFTENVEAIFSRSLTPKAQFYVVPTVSLNDRRLVQGALLSNRIPDLPGINAFSIGFGGALDIRPTVALVAEVIPTLVNGRDLGIHRPAYSFGIQKKIYRHAFTLGLTTSPGTTVSQRAGTNATFMNRSSADTPGGLFFGFDLTRQIH